MSMQFMDSCDHYNQNAYISLKWTINVIQSANSTPNGRNGRGVQPGSGIGKTLKYCAGWVVGFAYNPGAANGWFNSSIYLLGCPSVLGGGGMLYFASLQVEEDGTVSIYAGSTLIYNSSGAFTLNPNTWDYFEVKTELSGTTPIQATVTLRVNGQLLGSGTASTGINQTQTLLQQTEANYNLFIGGGTVDSSPTFDDIYVAALDGTGSVTNFAGDVQLGALFPRADATMNWTPTGASPGYACVNDTFAETNDDTIYIADETAGDLANFDWQPVSTFTGSIVAVHYGVLARKDQEGTRTFQQTAQTLDNGPVQSPGDAYCYYFYAMDEDPATTAVWTQAGFNAATFGVKLVS